VALPRTHQVYGFVAIAEPVRLLALDAAARYCGLKPRSFKHICPVRPVEIAHRTLVWDIVQLDAWIDEVQTGKAVDLDSLFNALK